MDGTVMRMRAEGVMQFMKYDQAELTDLDRFATDPNWVLEQKLDGVHVLLVMDGIDIRFLGSRGTPISYAAAAKWFPALRAELADLVMPGDLWVAEGELITETGILHLFDLPVLRLAGAERVSVATPFAQRREVLAGPIASILAENGISRVDVVAQAVTEKQKRDLVARVTAIGGEGFMAKRTDAKYEPGKRVQHSLKVKFVKTADCIVTSWERGHSSSGHPTGRAELAVHGPDGALMRVGACSLVGKPDVAVGDVVEVRYLAFRVQMMQPRMDRVRQDKSAAECDWRQFPAYSKQVI